MDTSATFPQPEEYENEKKMVVPKTMQMGEYTIKIVSYNYWFDFGYTIRCYSSDRLL